MTLRISEHRDLVPGVGGEPAFWCRVLVGRFEHDGQRYAVQLTLPRDEELRPERREALVRLLEMEAEALISARGEVS